MVARENPRSPREDTPKAHADGLPVYCAHDELVDPAALVPNPNNPNRHPDAQIELLAKIIRHQGWRAPITVSNRSGFIVRGHGRLLAALKLGVKLVPVDRQDYRTQAEEWADLVADNRLAELAEIERGALKDLIQTIDTGEIDLELTGYTEAEIEDLMTEFHVEAESDEEEFDLQEALANIVQPRCEPGELWRLGRHMLICGDAIEELTWQRLCRGRLVDLIVTSPPYNVSVQYASYKDKKTKAEYLAFIEAVARRMVEHIAPGRFVAWNVGVSPDSYPHHHVVRLEGCGLEFFRQIVWEKAGVPYPIFPSTLKARRARHYKPNYKHEMIYLFEAPGEAEGLPELECPICEGSGRVRGHVAPETHGMLVLLTSGTPELGGKAKPSRQYANDVWHIVQSAATTDLPTLGVRRTGLEHNGEKVHMLKAHPAAFPVELPRAVMTFLTAEGEAVCDPFVGAGTTIIAAERLGRVAYGIEIDPVYCELAMQRWEALTGETAVRAE